MEGYKKRMLYEYQQLVNRKIKLGNIIALAKSGDLGFELNCPIELLEKQLDIMQEYMKVLEERGQYEDIDLSFDMREAE